MCLFLRCHICYNAFSIEFHPRPQTNSTKSAMNIGKNAWLELNNFTQSSYFMEICALRISFLLQVASFLSILGALDLLNPTKNKNLRSKWTNFVVKLIFNPGLDPFHFERLNNFFFLSFRFKFNNIKLNFI